MRGFLLESLRNFRIFWTYWITFLIEHWFSLDHDFEVVQ